MSSFVRIGLGSLRKQSSTSSRFFCARTLSTNAPLGNGMDSKRSSDSFETTDEFEQRIFSGSSGGDSKTDAFFRKLDRAERYGKSSGNSQMMDGFDDTFSTLSDGMDGKLKNAATKFDFDEDELWEDEYSYRPDVNWQRATTYDLKDLDLTKPTVPKGLEMDELDVTTEEALKMADFRNVRFLANFITEAGIIIKRKESRISAKAQRKIAREIKTARAFGLMPFTTMGTKSFVFGNTMEDHDKDFEYETFDSRFSPDAE